MAYSLRKLTAHFLFTTLLFCLVLIGTTPAAAQTIIYVNDDASGGDGSQGAPYSTLQDALVAAENESGSVEIRVAAGIYYPDEGGSATAGDSTSTFALLPNVAIHGGYSETFGARDPEANRTVLSGDIDQDDSVNAEGVVTDPANGLTEGNAVHVVTAGFSTDATTILDGVTITAGYASECCGYNVDGSNGGGIKVQSPITIRDVRFVGNRAADRGGAMTASADATLTDVVFEHNQADFGAGGAVSASFASPTFLRATFRENIIINGAGGAYYGGGEPTFRDVVVENNNAGDPETSDAGEGGGVVIAGAATLENVIFRGNVADGGNGGGLLVQSSGSAPTITGTLFENNEAEAGGGAAVTGGSPTFTDVVFRGNGTSIAGSFGGESGGGLYVNVYNDSVAVARTQFVENTSISDGGGMAVSGGKHTLRDVTFTQNTAQYDGGGLSNDNATVWVNGSTFRGNEGSNGIVLSENGGETTLVNVLFSGNVSTSTSTGVVMNDYGTTTLTNVTITGNDGTALTNGAFSSTASTATIENSILYENDGGYSGNAIANNDGGTVNVQNTLVEGGLSGEQVENDAGSGAAINDNGGNTSGDPLFVSPIASADAPTTSGDFQLQSGSPALNAGDASLLPADTADVDDDGNTSESYPFDLDGRSRVSGSLDLGPYESGGALQTVTQSLSSGAATPLSVSLPDRFGMDLTMNTLNTDTDVTVTYDPTVESSDVSLPDDNGIALSSLWTVELAPEPSESDVDATLCFVLDDLTFPVVDRGELAVYARSTPSDPWMERTPTELRPSADQPEQLCLTGQSSFSQFAVGAPKSALPVELASFEAVRDGKQVELAWQTVSEKNNAGFHVERAVGEGAFEQIGFVSGAGTTTESRAYQFADADWPAGTETLTYRLRQVDHDGSSTLSEPVTVGLGAPEALTLAAPYPNPARSTATIRYALPSPTHVEVSIYDALGRQLKTVVHEEQEGRHVQAVDVQSLPSGIYFLRLRTDGTVKTRKLTIVR